MLRIRRLKTEIKTSNGVFGSDDKFTEGLNFIASEDNTCGKSSIIAAIYYCLGLEEIIGGRGEKVLTSVYKTSIEEGESVWPVLESGAYLEISNGKDVITIYRAAKMENRDSKLITVCHSELDDIGKPNILCEDMYVHMPNSAVNKKGFHSFLETFLHIELPLVPASDDAIRKLYLQLIFSGMFIEQKHGWADLLSGMPVLGIRESKKRVLEFILRLDTLENEKKKDYLRTSESNIKHKWESLVKELIIYTNRESCTISGLPASPKLLSEDDFSKILISKDNDSIEEYIEDLNEQYKELGLMKPKIIDNFDEIQEELNETENSIDQFESELHKHRDMLLSENSSIERLASNLEIIDSDIRNNKDAARLRDLGSELNLATSKDLCPVCSQAIQDTLIPDSSHMQVMSIDENIRHLNAQKEMLEFARNSHRQNKEKLQGKITQLENSLFKLRSLAKSLRSDLYSTNDNMSESIVYKRLQLDSEINNLNKLCDFLSSQKLKLKELSDDWKQYLTEKSGLPSKKFTDLDEEKIKTLRNHFINNLRQFGYKSILNLNQIDISLESYLPVIEGFDMKFDSSASDNIRAIWAFILALLQTSNEKAGNHPGVLIFDEPAQHSIVINDMEQFFNCIIKLKKSQVIVGITIKDSDTRQAISKLPSEDYNLIRVPNKAFRKFESESE
ncbi:hypothetical protein P9314_03040 [Paenibacillus validus]|uniref:hypothetical protein n=1 Tax=Paenibacillus TaxID=44249 RepID=UPI000FDC2BC5|nr:MULTISPECIES: hypothetical protein [Paenibacillus]MED4599680.1 hypothetical protein [Paenibacillus validus]MED4604887.1 hypothetical protein [Paenibacillus validus]